MAVFPELPPNLFYPLSPRSTMLLCVIFTQDGQDDLHMLEQMNEDDAFLLQEKAEQILALDGDQRAALVVREMRRQLQFGGLVGLEAIDPSWLLAGLRGEQPRTIGIILSQLSTGARERVLSRLPDAVRERVPSKDDLRNVRVEVMRLVRQRFASRFATMPPPPGEPTHFYFKDVALLKARELLHLVRALGIDQLAAAFHAVGRRKLAELCTRLHRHAAQELVDAFKETELRDAMSFKEANDFMAWLVLGLHPQAGERGKDQYQGELFQKAGLFRLANAACAERPEFIRQLAQRIPRAHGKLLAQYVERAHEAGALDEVRLRRLQDLVLLRIEKLAARGEVNPRYLAFEFCFWGEDEEAEPEDQA